MRMSSEDGIDEPWFGAAAKKCSDYSKSLECNKSPGTTVILELSFWPSGLDPQMGLIRKFV